MKSILLLGDSCIDFYHIGTVDRISPEAPVPIINVNRNVEVPGMATNVFRNLEAFGHSVTYKTNGEIIEKHRCIDEKSMQHVLRMDVETEIEPLHTEDVPLELLRQFDAICISDYDKGYITYEMIRHIIGNAECPIFIDSKKSDGSVFDTRRQDVWIKINEDEYNNMVNQLSENLSENFIITRGAKGAMWSGELYEVDPIHLFDATGAGDVFLSAFAHSKTCGLTVRQAIQFANECARLSTKYSGVYTIQQSDIESVANKLRVEKYVLKQEDTSPSP